MLLALFLGLVFSVQTATGNQGPRLLDLLDQSGLDYEKIGSRWQVEFSGKNKKAIYVIAAQVDDVIVLATFGAYAKEQKNIDALNKELMKLNIDYDHVKIGTDDDGDYQIRHDVKTAGLTGATLADFLNNLASVADGLEPIFAKYKK